MKIAQWAGLAPLPKTLREIVRGIALDGNIDIRWVDSVLSVPPPIVWQPSSTLAVPIMV